MYKSKYNLEKDLLICKMINNKNISDYTITNYFICLDDYLHANNITNFTEYILQLKNQQNDIIKGNMIIRYDVQYSELSQQIDVYKQYLKNKKNNNNTINKRLTTLTTILHYFNIQTPNNILLEKQERNWTIISKNEIKYILNISNLNHKAIILLLTTTGMRRQDLLNLNVIDFFNATNNYHNCKNITDFVENAPEDMLGFWSFEPQKTRKSHIKCKVCCTPETSNAILLMLRERQKKLQEKGLKIEANDPLFTSKNHKSRLKPITITSLLKRKQNQLKEERNRLLLQEKNNGSINEYEYLEKIKECPTISPHALRKFFISTLAENIGNLRVCALMEGHAPPMNLDVNYVQINDGLIKDEYMKLIPALSFEKVKVDLLTSQRKVELEEKIEHLEKENKRIRENIRDEATRAVERALNHYHDNVKRNAKNRVNQFDW